VPEEGGVRLRPHYTVRIVATHPGETSFYSYPNSTAKDECRKMLLTIRGNRLLQSILLSTDCRLELWIDDLRLLSFAREDL